MITVRKSSDRGHFDHGWLETFHTFSFADYHDPRHMGFRSLRVINEDTVQPGEGFDMHPHRDMEILTYILEGELEHKDSMGNGSVIRPGDAQRMSAGTGVLHSEFNYSKAQAVHLLQIWILPERKGIQPGYEQRQFRPVERENQLRLIASRDGHEGSNVIHQDVSVYASILEAGKELRHELKPGRGAWLQVARGALELNGAGLSAGDGVPLSAGDGAAIEGERAISIRAREKAELILFDLA